MGKRHLKSLRNFIKTHSKKEGSFKEILDDRMQESADQNPIEKILDETKYFWFKKKNWNKTIPSVVSMMLVCVLLVYQNCGGKGGGGGSGGGSSTTTSASTMQNIPTDLLGKYFLVLDETSKKIAFLELSANSYSLEIQNITSSSEALVQSNEARIESKGDNQYIVSYSKESCNPISKESVQIKKGTTSGTLEISMASGVFVFKKNDRFTPPIWASNTQNRNEDHQCFSQNLKTTPASLTVSDLKKQYPCLSGLRKSLNSHLYSATLKGTYTEGSLNGNIEALYVGLSSSADIVAISQLEGGSFNLEASFCADNTTPAPFIDSSTASVQMTGEVRTTSEMLPGFGKLFSPGVKIIAKPLSGTNIELVRDFDFSFGDRPSIVISYPNKSAVSSGPVTYTINFLNAESLASDVDLIRTGTANADIAITGSGNQTRTVTISNITGDGTLAILVPDGVAQGSNGNHSLKTSSSSSVIVDNTGPTVSISSPSRTLTNSQSLTYTLDFLNSSKITLLAENIILNKSGTANASISLSGTGTSKVVTLSNIIGDGTLWLTIPANAAEDDIGNLSKEMISSAVVVDNTKPTYTVSSPSSTLTKSGLISYNINYSDAATITLSNSYVSLMKTGNANGSLSISGTGNQTRTVTISGITGDGTLAISIQAGTSKDLAGNLSEAKVSSSFNVDNTGPTLTAPSINTSLSNSSSTSPSISWNASASSDISRYEYCVGRSPTLCDVVSWTSNGLNTSLTITGLSLSNTTSYFINLRAVDSLGNYSQAVSSSWETDFTPPAVITNLTLISNQGDATPVKPKLSWTPSGSTDVAKYEYSVGTTSGASDIIAWTSAGLSTSITLSGFSLNDMTYYANVRAVDKAGNFSGSVSSSWQLNHWNLFTQSSPTQTLGGRSAVWTGSEIMTWGGGLYTGSNLNTGISVNPFTGTSTSISTLNAPSARSNHSSIWTGSEMIIWGGHNLSTYSAYNNGSRYNPTTNTWTTLPTSNAPAARFYHTAIWTGTEMIIWGGLDSSGSVPYNSGARYNPTTNTWVTMSLTNAPTARSENSVVWTGTEMIVWGGFNVSLGIFNDGAKYNPATNTWTPISKVNAPTARMRHTAVWTGTEMVVWGGGANIPNDGARYNPVTDTWTQVTQVNAPSARYYHSAVWTGTEMLIWGGNTGGAPKNDGARYSPSTDSWISLSTYSTPVARSEHSAFWSSKGMVVWGGLSCADALNNCTRNDGGIWNP